MGWMHLPTKHSSECPTATYPSNSEPTLLSNHFHHVYFKLKFEVSFGGYYEFEDNNKHDDDYCISLSIWLPRNVSTPLLQVTYQGRQGYPRYFCISKYLGRLT